MNRPTDDPLTIGPAVVVIGDSVAERRSATASALGAGGYRTFEAATIAQVVACWRAAEPDVVILDIDLDGGDVQAVVSMICSARSRDHRTAMITISNDPGPERVVECLRLGSWDHLRAPFHPAELVARVGTVLRLADDYERLRRRNEELEYLGSTDALTGLANRRVVEEELGRQVAAAARHHQALSAILVAIDRWEEHETAGAPRADAIVQEVAALIAAIARTGDTVGRFHNDEFLVVLPMTDSEGARIFAERVRAVITAAPMATPTGPVEVSVSAGCASDAPGAPELLARAITALRQAQALGGNTLVAISS